MKAPDEAVMMLVLHVPNDKGADWVYAALLKNGFSFDREIVPAYPFDENDLPAVDGGIYLMQEIAPGQHS